MLSRDESGELEMMSWHACACQDASPMSEEVVHTVHAYVVVSSRESMHTIWYVHD